MPLGRCVMRTAESVLLTCWPAALDAGELLGDLVGQLGVAAELDEVLDVALEVLELGELAGGPRVLGGDLGRRVAVVPEALGLHLLFERADALAQRSRVKDSPRAA